MANKTIGTELKYCSFCNKSQHEVKKLVAGTTVHICDECVSLCNDILGEPQDVAGEIEGGKLPIPEAIAEHLDGYVIGQDYAKRVLAVAVYNHYKRLRHTPKNGDVELSKSNILIVGPTGSGKTLLAQTLARSINVPFAIADATTLTEAGYVGDDVENIISKLLQNADGDVEKAQRGIIYIDEIDKISRKSENASITRDVSGEGVQQALLKLIEGTKAGVPTQGGRKSPNQQLTEIDTSNILFICGGAFDGLDKVISQRTDKSGIGFSASVKASIDPTQTAAAINPEPDDFVRFGLIPELIGRLPVVATLSELDVNALVRILVEPKNALVKQYAKLVEMDGATLEIEPDAMQEIARQALARRTGARGLRAILEKVLLEVMYELPGHQDVEKVIITRDNIENNTKPTMVRKKAEAKVSNG